MSTPESYRLLPEGYRLLGDMERIEEGDFCFGKLDNGETGWGRPHPGRGPRVAHGIRAALGLRGVRRRGWSMKLGPRELATVLAGLRYWQRLGVGEGGPEEDIATDGGSIEPLNEVEIDALCERLNTEVES